MVERLLAKEEVTGSNPASRLYRPVVTLAVPEAASKMRFRRPLVTLQEDGNAKNNAFFHQNRGLHLG